MLLESRRIAALLLTRPDDQTWSSRIEAENLLQKNTPSTAKRQARLIRRRLETMGEGAWRLIAEGESEVAIQLLFACSIKHSALVGDFVSQVYADRLRRLERTFGLPQWETFLDHCAHLDPVVLSWSEGTKAKLFQVIVRMLVEVKLLDSARSRHMTPRTLHPVVRRYLLANQETNVLDCLERIQ
jgi:hypothetical protein